MSRVLFVCLHNAGRSQMSQALFERAAAGSGHEVASAGTTPGERVHPEVVQVMGELDIDLTDRVPQRLTGELAAWADVVVTMGCGDACPYVPGVRYVDWDLPDPKGRPIDEVRATGEEIARRVEAFSGPFRGSESGYRPRLHHPAEPSGDTLIVTKLEGWHTRCCELGRGRGDAAWPPLIATDHRTGLMGHQMSVVADVVRGKSTRRVCRWGASYGRRPCLALWDGRRG